MNSLLRRSSLRLLSPRHPAERSAEYHANLALHNLALQSLLVLWLSFPAAMADETRVDFGRDIRPILSDKCFVCHGPDAGQRATELRLDQADSALEHAAIVPGDLAGSQAWSRIQSVDESERMPPPESGKSLTEAEVAKIKAWIEQGAEYQQHWAFLPPRRRDLPAHQPAQDDLSQPLQQPLANPIDRFVAARLHQQGLRHSPPADRATLVRRLYLDLLGLPPSPTELDRWLAIDDEPLFREQIVQELLDSPHYGERWGRWWLDAARYADSDGYEKDKPRSVWFYRDWVVSALNDDMPYDQFIIEQVAGDLLPQATQSQQVATGFLRNSMINEEGGADPEQFRVEGMFDRMDAIGKAILGITTQCAQCHTHKYDPLTQREYYQMYAALNDFHEATISVFTPEQATLRDQIVEEIEAINDEIRQLQPQWPQQLDAWEQQQAAQFVRWHTLTPTDLPFSGQKFRLLEDGSILSESYAPTRTTDAFKLTTRLDKVTAFRLDALLHPELPRGGPGRSTLGSGAVTEFQVTIAPLDKSKPARQVKFVRGWSDAVSPRSELLPQYRDKDAANDKRVTGPIEYAFDGDPLTAWTTDTGPATRNLPRVAVFFPEEELSEIGEAEIVVSLQQNHGGWNSDDNQNYLLGRYRFSYTDAPLEEVERSLPQPAAIELTAGSWSDVEAALMTPRGERTQHQQATLFAAWRDPHPDFANQRQRIHQLLQRFPETDTQLVVASRAAGPRPTFVFDRGDFLKPTDMVEPGAPDFLGSFSTADTPPRLRFARWLVRRDAPTTARVVVNRVWQAYFGRGLVDTPEDFGLQSATPSHPDLLDWLAVEFMESGWSLKHLHRLITDSQTYRQQAIVTPALAEADPQNILLARGPRMRVDAETVRDIALRISGLLNEQIGGPSVYPPAPDFLFQPPASYGPKVWNTEQGEQAYRRSLYVHHYRSVPYPSLQIFDAPKGDAACVRRERSNTPLQALVLLNEPQFVSAARAFASRVLRAEGELLASPATDKIARDTALLQFAHRWATSRRATDEELLVLLGLLNRSRERVAAGELSAELLLNAPSGIVTELSGQPAGELAAWMIVCRTLLNLDETISK